MAIPVTITMSPHKLANLLVIVTKQRERALNKAETDYGKDHAVVAQLSQDLADLAVLVAELRTHPKLPFVEDQSKKR